MTVEWTKLLGRISPLQAPRRHLEMLFLSCLTSFSERAHWRSMIPSRRVSPARLQKGHSFARLDNRLPHSILFFSLSAGVWKSAKLKVKNSSNEVTVIVRHAPLSGIAEEIAAKLFKKERQRLMDMLAYEPIFIPESSSNGVFKGLSVKVVKFHIENCPVRPSPMSSANSPRNKSVAQKRSLEAYESMLHSESGGDVCLLEKTYVLVGVNPRHESLLLAGLQQIVNSERNVSDHLSDNVIGWAIRVSAAASYLFCRQY